MKKQVKIAKISTYF